MEDTPIGDNSDIVQVALPTNILAQIDAQVGSSFVDREDFIRAAVRRYLEYLHANTYTHDEAE